MEQDNEIWFVNIIRETISEKSYTKYGQETSPISFSNWEFLKQSEILNRWFLLYDHVEGCKNILKLRC